MHPSHQSKPARRAANLLRASNCAAASVDNYACPPWVVSGIGTNCGSWIHVVSLPKVSIRPTLAHCRGAIGNERSFMYAT